MEENLGHKIKRAKRFKRLRRMSADGSDEDEQAEKENIAKSIFEDDADDNKKVNFLFPLEEAREIFGVDFDYNQFDQNNQKDDDDDGNEEEEEEEGTRKCQRKSTAKTIFEVYEPIELKKAFLTDVDQQIRVKDIPERMQLRSIPIIEVKDKRSHELVEEAKWIYKNAFNNHLLQKVEDKSDSAHKSPKTVGKVRNALELMRCDLLEVPFIAFYRKEFVSPELNINDLWKIFKLDATWCGLRQRKFNLLNLIENMRELQLETVMKESSESLPDDIRVIKDQDIKRVYTIESEEERKDVYNHFMLYYNQAEENGEKSPAESAEEEKEEEDSLKQAVRSGPYSIYRRAGLCSFAKKFGLTPEHFAENVRDSYQRHEVEQDPVEPSVIAQNYLGANFETTEQVLKAVQHMVAIQLAREPLLRKCARELYTERAKITVRPTKNGIKVIDESHQLYSVKYLKDKPVRDLVDHIWLKLLAAETDGLVTITFSDTVEGTLGSDFIIEFSQLYIKDEFSNNVQEWNDLRRASVKMALRNYIIPDLKNELKTKMTVEAKEAIMYACCQKLDDWIKFQPYTCTLPEEFEEDYEWSTKDGFRSIGIAYVPDSQEAAYASAVLPTGTCYNFLKMLHLLKRIDSFNQQEKLLKEADMLALKNFIEKCKPHVIVVTAESKEALMICNDVKKCLKELTKTNKFPSIQVELCDPNVAKIYSTSNRGITELPSYPPILRVATSLARRILNPLGEFAQLCNADQDLLCLRFHTLQDLLNKEELLTELYYQFVNRVNEVGVDVNNESSCTGSLLQFISGLGPRKAQNMLKLLKHKHLILNNRTELVHKLHFGPTVFINCVGFIKIDGSVITNRSDVYQEPLDETRIHPESYEWANKMAIDALEDKDQDMDQFTATERIMKTSYLLDELDLEAFAEQLKKLGFSEKLTTLLDIKEELKHPYKDMRRPYLSLSAKEIFNLLTKETPETFYVGKLVQATVVG
ncbi:GSCOCG00001857001-RA-CDS, partial [Cotesia congregata]